MGGLMAVKRGVCHLAGAHLLDTSDGSYNKSYVKRYLPDTPVRLVNLVLRDQGLIVPKGNPAGREAVMQFIATAQEVPSQLAILEHAIAITTVTGNPPAPTGARHPSIAPFETFHASDGLFVIAAGNDALFEKLCVTLDLPLSDDPRFQVPDLYDDWSTQTILAMQYVEGRPIEDATQESQDVRDRIAGNLIDTCIDTDLDRDSAAVCCETNNNVVKTWEVQ